MILLSPGPLHLILAGPRKTRVAGYLLAILGGALVLLTPKRGTLLAVAAVAIFWSAYRYRRIRYLLAAALLAMALLIPFKGADLLESLNPEIPADASILHRLELYPFALHVWKSHPVTGIGLRPLTHEKYLSDYQQHNMKLSNFNNDIKKLQTFDNMLVTSLVELGTLMTLVYLGFVMLIMVKYWFRLRLFEEPAREDLYRFFVLLGVVVHSMTYDSLLFPPINWLFHVHLGILAGYSGSVAAAHNPAVGELHES